MTVTVTVTVTVLPCGCPIAPRTAAEFRAAAACPSTWEGDVADLVRMAERLERLERRAVAS